MNEYLTLINLIKCAGIAGLVSIAVIVWAFSTVEDYPDDDGESM